MCDEVDDRDEQSLPLPTDWAVDVRTEPVLEFAFTCTRLLRGTVLRLRKMAKE